MDLSWILEIIITILHLLSILGSIVLIFSFSRFSQKTVALQMISILGITNLLFHCMAISFEYFPKAFSKNIGPIMISTVLRFSIFWSTSLAFLLFKSPTKTSAINAKQFTTNSFIATFPLALILSIVSQLTSFSAEIKSSLTTTIPLTLAFVFTIICYIKSLMVIKLYSSENQQRFKSALTKLFLYPIVQTLATLPALVYFFSDSIWNATHSVYTTVSVTIPFCLVGFILTCIFIVQEKGKMSIMDSSVLLETADRSLGGIEDNEKLIEYQSI